MQASSVHQLDIESGKVVAEWKFQKDGVDIGMRDITNDTKSSQLDASRATFMGLDDNRLVRWDMRDRNGIVQVRKPPPVGDRPLLACGLLDHSSSAAMGAAAVAGTPIS
jgi:hypothetical protein